MQRVILETRNKGPIFFQRWENACKISRLENKRDVLFSKLKHKDPSAVCGKSSLKDVNDLQLRSQELDLDLNVVEERQK